MTGFLIKYRFAVIILFYLFQFTWFYTSSSLLALEEIGFPAWVSLIFLVTIWLSLLFDMMRRETGNKTFWLLSMLIFPWLAPAIYLFQRKKTYAPTPSFFGRRK
ncbi:PLDc N-terminal domain-containing protein [Salinimicrobium catena]|uniref:PLDc N-terminal domain-containing protein n=1 Tax=Salinimicrobium catena TaxID=390640 RepID=UPI000B857613|nr:PLDc N-terminal domain-containing protein [Salinimicrobium catena]